MGLVSWAYKGTALITQYTGVRRNIYELQNANEPLIFKKVSSAGLGITRSEISPMELSII